MKKIFAVCLCLLMMASLFAGCGDKKEAAEEEFTGLFQYDMSEYIDIGEYKGIEISSDDEEFLEVVLSEKDSELQYAGYKGEEVEIASGKVKLYDTATLTYVGSCDGEVFDSNTTGYDLIIGSGQFIDGFEEGLIGTDIGSKVTLNLTFPDPYPNSEELSGKDAVFEVVVKSVTRLVYPEVTEKIAKDLGYDDLDSYNAHIFSTAVQAYCHEKLADGAKWLKVPEKEVDYFADREIDYYTSMAAAYGVDFATYFGVDEETYKKQNRKQHEETALYNAVLYYIAQKENLLPTADEIEVEYEYIASRYSNTSSTLTVEDVKKEIDYNQVEYNVVHEKARQFLFENANIGK